MYPSVYWPAPQLESRSSYARRKIAHPRSVWVCIRVSRMRLPDEWKIPSQTRRLAITPRDFGRMFLITLVAVILLPASVINSKLLSIGRNTSIAAPFSPYIFVSIPVSVALAHFSVRFRRYSSLIKPSACTCAAACLPSSKESSSRRDCARRNGENRSWLLRRPTVMSRVKHGTKDSIISGLRNRRPLSFLYRH